MQLRCWHMKKWECGVCGFLHDGEEAPEKCPVCEAPQKMFSEVVAAVVGQDSEAAAVTEDKEQSTPAPQSAPAKTAATENTQWRCTVCGYIHTGIEPPDKCPVCDAPASMFERVEEEGAGSDASSAKRWRCTVCGYIHQGDSPPDKCPVCAADKTMFVEVDESGKQLGESPVAGPDPLAGTPAIPEAPLTFFDRIAKLILNFHLHPITTHFPNGILPAAVVFLGLFLLFGIEPLEKAAFYNNIFVLIMLPVVLLTGFVEWQKRYKGLKSAIFIIKIICGIVVIGAANILVFWRIIDPAVTAADSPTKYIYFGIAVGMLAAAGIAGHLGGNLVFKARG